jgi:transposase
LTNQAAQDELLRVIHQSPRLFGLGRHRWWLAGLRQVVDWMAELSLAGIHQILRRLHIHYKRGRRYVHSPDLLYEHKMFEIQVAQAFTRGDRTRFVFLYQDEVTYYRRATVDRGYARAGSDEPRAHQGVKSNTKRHIAGCLNLLTGQLFYWQRSSFGRSVLIRFYRAVEAAYPDAALIFIAQDNWPTHRHPDILTALENSRIVLLFLPTYAPWTNPIEKVWRRLYQEVLHHHPFVDDWDGLKEAVERWLSQWASPSPDLLAYVGLGTD